MNAANLPALRQHRWLVAALAGGAALVAWFLATDASDYLTFTPDGFTAYYWPRRFGLVLHIGGGTSALCVGLLQVWLGLTGRTGRWHRYLGRAYVIAVLIGSIGAFYMAVTMPPPWGAYAFGLDGLGMAWVVTTAIAYFAIRRGALARHRSWMIRSYLVTFGFVTFRIINLTLVKLGVGNEDSQTGAAAWLCWTIPLLLAEIGLRWSRSRRASPLAA